MHGSPDSLTWRFFPPSRGPAQASDQYLLEGLKRLCEHAIAQSLDVACVLSVYDHSESYSAPQLAKRCILFALEHYDDVLVPGGAGASSEPGMSPAIIMQRMAPTLRQALYAQVRPPGQCMHACTHVSLCMQSMHTFGACMELCRAIKAPIPHRCSRPSFACFTMQHA